MAYGDRTGNRCQDGIWSPSRPIVCAFDLPEPRYEGFDGGKLPNQCRPMGWETTCRKNEHGAKILVSDGLASVSNRTPRS
jgi:hypothetical protein